MCRLHGVRKLKVFRSVLRPDFDPQRSDVDVLVEFEPQVADSFANFLDLKEALEGLLGRRVDVVELGAIRNRRLRRHIKRGKSPVCVQRPLASGVCVVRAAAEEASEYL